MEFVFSTGFSNVIYLNNDGESIKLNKDKDNVKAIAYAPHNAQKKLEIKATINDDGSLYLESSEINKNIIHDDCIFLEIKAEHKERIIKIKEKIKIEKSLL